MPWRNLPAMCRGNARQVIFRDDIDRQSLLDDLEDSLVHCGWELSLLVFMPNHFHLVLRTPRPNLGKKMHHLLISHAKRFARRHRRPVHLFQGRYMGELIEVEGSQAIVDRIRRELQSPRFADEVPRVSTLEAIDVATVIPAVSDYYQV